MNPAIILLALAATFVACTTGPIGTPTASPDQWSERLEPAEIESLMLYLDLTYTPLKSIAGITPAILDLAALEGDGLVSDSVKMTRGLIIEMEAYTFIFLAVAPPDIATEYHEETAESLTEIQNVLMRLEDLYIASDGVGTLTDRDAQILGNTYIDILRQLRDAFEHFSISVHGRTKLLDLVES